MEEKIEKIIELSGNKNRFQYFLEIIIILYWINCNLLSVSLPYLENTSIVSYYDSEKNETIKESMNYDLCKMEKDETFEIVETYKYSWVIEQNLECNKVKTGLIGTIAFTGNMLGALSYPFVSKYIKKKKCLLIGTSLFIILLIICLFINEFWFYLITLIICNIGSNLMCYSTLTIAGEISAPKLRALFGSLTNFGFGAGGIFYIIMFWVLDSWKWVFIICAIFLFVLGIIVIIFFLESPRYVLQKNVDDFIDILRSIAKFNGRLEIFDKELKEQEFQEIINYLKIHNKELKDENESKIVSNKVNQKLTINFNENYNIQLPTESPNIVPIDKKNKKNQIENDSSLYSDLKNNLQNNLNKENDSKEENLQKHNKRKETADTIQIYNTENIQIVSKNDSKKDNNKQTEKEKINSNQDLKKHKNNKNTKKNLGLFALLKYRSLRYKFLLMCLIWFSCSGIYNGMTLGIKSLPGDIYINGILLFGVELISYILSGVLMDWPLLGRKKTAIITLFLSAFFMLFLVIFIENDTCSVIFYMIIRVCITIPFTEFYTYCLEIYPTSVRGVGFGINAVCNNIGGIVVPMVLELLSSRVIYIIFTVMCGVCGLLFFTMEETVGKPMPETIKEIEEEEIKNKIEMEQMQQISI